MEARRLGLAAGDGDRFLRPRLQQGPKFCPCHAKSSQAVSLRPAAVARLTRASSENLPSLPRIRSFSRGRVTPSRAAAAPWDMPQDLTCWTKALSNSARLQIGRLRRSVRQRVENIVELLRFHCPSFRRARPAGCQIDVMLRSPLGFLLAGMQHHNLFADRGDINHRKGACRFSYSDLTNPGPAVFKGFQSAASKPF